MLKHFYTPPTWWAAIYGVAQSRTWLRQLSSSSNQFAISNNIFLLFFLRWIYLYFKVCFIFSQILFSFLISYLLLKLQDFFFFSNYSISDIFCVMGNLPGSRRPPPVFCSQEFYLVSQTPSFLEQLQGTEWRVGEPWKDFLHVPSGYLVKIKCVLLKTSLSSVS